MSGFGLSQSQWRRIETGHSGTYFNLGLHNKYTRFKCAENVTKFTVAVKEAEPVKCAQKVTKATSDIKELQPAKCTELATECDMEIIDAKHDIDELKLQDSDLDGMLCKIVRSKDLNMLCEMLKPAKQQT